MKSLNLFVRILAIVGLLAFEPLAALAASSAMGQVNTGTIGEAYMKDVQMYGCATLTHSVSRAVTRQAKELLSQTSTQFCSTDLTGATVADFSRYLKAFYISLEDTFPTVLGGVSTEEDQTQLIALRDSLKEEWFSTLFVELGH